jgi:hypothetical protein
MTEERKKVIKEELQKRVNLWLENSTFEEMTIGGSYTRFDMATAPIGYPLEGEEWMNENDFKEFVSMEEYHSDDFTKLSKDLFREYYEQQAS